MSSQSQPQLHNVLLTRSEIAQLRDLIAADSKAADLARRTILAPAHRANRRAICIPDRAASSQPLNFDMRTGSPFAYDPQQPTCHRSEAGAILEGDEYDATWAVITHNLNANAARDGALAAVLFDDEAGAQRSRELLLRYAEIYLERPPRGKLSCTLGRLHCSGLEEAVWSISMIWSAHLLDHIGALSEADLDLLREKLFEPIVDLLWGEWYFPHNIRMWHNAAIGCIGLAYNDRATKREAIHGPMGFRQQCVDGFRADGLLYEGSPGYHGYALGATLILAEAMARNGYEPYHDDHLRQMLLVPVRLMQPDGSVPALNDYCRVSTLPTRVYGTALRRLGDDPEIRAAAGLAFRQWHDIDFGPDHTASKWNCTTGYFARQQVDWLLAWDRIDPTLTSRPPRTVAMTPSGIGVLRPDDGEYLLLKCSAKGSGHDHHDKLSLIWWQSGKCWLTDMGTTNNHLDLHENWFKHTLGHNTAIVDGSKQERCDATLARCDGDVIIGEARPYPQTMPDVYMRRCVEHHDSGSLHDHLTVDCQHIRTVDYVLRPVGELHLSQDVEAAPSRIEGGDVGYDILTDIRQIAWRGSRRLTWRQGRAVLTVDLSAMDESATCWIARGPIDPLRQLERGDMLIVRVHAAKAEFNVTMAVDTVDASPEADDTAGLKSAVRV